MTLPNSAPPGSPLLPPPNPPPWRSDSLPPSVPPLVAPPATQATPTRTKLWIALGALASLAVLVGLGYAAVRGLARHRPSGFDERAVVRVVSGNTSGTGFFVAPPQGQSGVLVVTAFHVVDSGSAAIVERVVRTSDKDAYVEAYPQTELVAFDAASDLAVLRIQNLPETSVVSLAIAPSATRDEPVISCGFPASSFADRVGLIKKEGKLLDFARLPVVDHTRGRILREGAVDGLIVSSDLEPGFSGGPTCNARGEVIGVNVIKDTQHRGQNGVVAAAALTRLLESVRPAAPPTPQDVETLLASIQDQQLLLPVDDRANVAEYDLVASTDLPHLRALIAEMRAMDLDTAERDFGGGIKGSNRALLGLLVARLPGRALETYRASSTQDAIRRCEETAQGIRRFLGGLADGPVDAPPTDCLRLGTRALAWDLAAVSLEWSGAPRQYSVTKIDEVDAGEHVHRVSVRMSGIASLVPLYVAWEGGRLRLKLFDKKGQLYAIDGTRGAVATDFEGAWVARRERGPDPAVSGVEADSEEHLVVTITGTDAVAITHRFRSSRYTGKPDVSFSCNRRPSIVDAGTQALGGKLHNGTITASSTRVELGSDGCKRCGLCTMPHKLVVLKLHAGKLLLYRTNGVAAPELVEFVRESGGTP